MTVITDQRIFRDGIATNGKLIGVYSASYQKTRSRENYPTSRKVILQATSAMVNDWKLIVLPGNNYGSGFTSSTTSEAGNSLTNYEKSFMVERTYRKSIFALTDSEDKKMEKELEKELSKLLSKL